MSGWIGTKFWKSVWVKVPTRYRSSVQKATAKANEVFSAEVYADNSSRPVAKASKHQSSLVVRGRQR